MGPIARAVTQAVQGGQDERFAEFLPQLVCHRMHVRFSGPDGYDPEAMRRLAAAGTCSRAQMTHVERRDGSLMPWLLGVSHSDVVPAAFNQDRRRPATLREAVGMLEPSYK